MKFNLPIERGQLDGLVVFLHVAERRSFRLAAKQLGISPSAVSQAVRALETRIGVPLLARTTRSVGLTEAGQRLLGHVRPAVDMLTTGFESTVALKGEASGLLRINVPDGLQPLLVNRLLPDFCAAYPSVQLELYTESRLIDIVAEGFDAGIRIGELVAADMVAVRLTPSFRFVVAGTPAFFREHGKPVTPQDLQRFKCIQLRMSSGATYNWEFVVGGEPVSIAVSGPLIVNDVDMNLRAALLGVGLAYVPEPLVMFHIANGQLEPVLQEFFEDEPGLVLYYPSRSQALPKLKAFVEFARSRMRREFRPSDYLMTATMTGMPEERRRKKKS